MLLEKTPTTAGELGTPTTAQSILKVAKRMKNKSYISNATQNDGVLFEQDIKIILDDKNIAILKHNVGIYDPVTNVKLGEIDFEIGNTIIESTVGTTSKTSQMKKYTEDYPTLFNPGNKRIVIYGPQYRTGAIENEITSRGGIVIREFEDFLNLLR